MKILQAMAGGERGGAENFFVRLAIAINRAGIDQSVVIRKNKKRAKSLVDAGVEIVELPFGGFFDWRTRTSLKKQIGHFKPSIVLSWMNRATKFCSTDSDSEYIHIARLGGYYDLKYYQNCQYLIGNTENIVNYIKSAGWPAEKVQYLPNFVSVNQNKAIERDIYFTPKSAPLILALGRFHKNKGFDVLLRALSHVPGAYLWLAGDGPLRVQLEALAEKLGVKPRVRFVGWHEDISPLLNAADIFVCPSRHEPLGNVIIEAWAHQIPVVASDSDGPGALIEHLVSGILVPIENDEMLSKAIRNLIADHQLRAKVLENGFHHYNTCFTEKIVIEKYINFFQRVIEKCAESPE